MRRLPTLTDDALRRALAPDLGRGAPVELRASIVEEVARTPQRAGPLIWRPWTVGAARERGSWVLVAAAATLVLLAGLLLTGGGRPPQLLRPALVLPPLATGGDYDALFLAVGLEDVWVADRDGELWHGTAVGWTGPESSPATGVRALALLPDKRLVIAGDGGLRVRQQNGQWSLIGDSDSNDMTIGSDGTIWVTEGRRLASYSEAADGWKRTSVECPSGGTFLAVASDDAVWTGGFAYPGTLGLARLDGTQCDEVFVLDGRTHEVYGLAAGPNERIVVRMSDLPTEQYNASGIDPGVRIVLWDGSTWTMLPSEPAPSWSGIAVGPDGAVFVAGDQGINRYRDGRWQTVVDQVAFAEMSTWISNVLARAPDGTLWYASRRPGHTWAVEQVPNTDPGN